MVGKMMVSTFLANQAKEMSKVAIAVPSSFVMRVSGAHIKQQTSPGPVALSVFNRLGCFKLRILELLTPAPASILFFIVYNMISTEELSAFTSQTWCCCSLFSAIRICKN